MPDTTKPPITTLLTPGRPADPHWHPGELSLEQVTALVDCASGADTAGMEALQAVVANLHRAAHARAQLAACVPPEMLRQVLVARAQMHLATESAPGGDDGLPS